MESVFKNHILVLDSSKRDLIKFVGEQKFDGAQKICQDVLDYISDFPGFYEIVDRGINGDYLKLKKQKNLKKDSDIDFNYYIAKIMFPNGSDLLSGHTAKKRCLINIAFEKEERNAEIKKEKSIYGLYICQ